MNIFENTLVILGACVIIRSSNMISIMFFRLNFCTPTKKVASARIAETN